MRIRASRSIFQRFFRIETLGGFVLLLCATCALLLANSPFAPLYTAFWHTKLSAGSAGYTLTLSLHECVNDGLMTIFFLVVGLEIKRELLAGELASPQKAALPIAAAVGGMVVPALIYFACNPTGTPARGWGIPMATDIAFALGALSLIAPGASPSVRVFLAALAIVDDVGAVLVIALFYSGPLAWHALAGAAGVLVFLILINVVGVTKLWPYLVAGGVLWFFVHESGVHATIAGVALAMVMPTRTRINAAEFSSEARRLLDDFDRRETGDFLVLTSKGQQESLFALGRASVATTAPILRLEHALHRFSAFFVMPVFAFANAGVQFAGSAFHAGVATGVLAGLTIGKPLGITVASVAAVKFGIAKLPGDMGWSGLHAASWLAGIGFTLSLFIAALAFRDDALIDAAKVATFGASLLSAVIAIVAFYVVNHSGKQTSVLGDADRANGS